MDHRLLQYYNRELQYIRELGGEFAREFPKIAGRLALDAFECADPYVERLLEGFAFLAARVQLKIDSEFPRFSDHLLEMVYPHYLCPTPSMAVVQFIANQKQLIADGYTVARGTPLKANLGKGDQTACEYRTAHELSLWPFEIVSIAHSGYVSELGDVRLPSRKQIKGVFRIRLRALNDLRFSTLAVDRLPLFIRGAGPVPIRLHELLAGHSIGMLLRDPDRTFSELVTDEAVEPLGFEDDQALLPYTPRSFQGYRLLHEYFAFPSRFSFVELRSLQAGVRRCHAPELEIVILLDRHDAFVETGLTPSHVALHCTPAVNLFPRKADRIHLSEAANEYHVVPDRTRPLDLEVYSVTEVVGFGATTDVRRDFRPFYSLTERAPGQDGSYYTVHRQPRMNSTRQKMYGPRSTYLGQELFLALVDGNEGPYRSDLRQLAVSTLCTNRDLPLSMPVGTGKSDFYVESGAPVDSVRCVAGPSVPRQIHAWGQTTWSLISHLALNYLSITQPEGMGVAPLRDLLQLYADLAEPELRRQIEGITSVSSVPIIRRVSKGWPPSLARGLEVTLTCDETAFEGTSVFLMGAVLDRFFAKYVSINGVTETVLKTTQRGEIARWPTRIGRRSIA